MADPKVIQWKFAAIGDDDLKQAIKDIGEDGVRQAVAKERAEMRAAVEARRAMDQKLGTARTTEAAIRAAIARTKRPAKKAEAQRWKEVEKTAARIEREMAQEVKRDERRAEQRVKREQRDAERVRMYWIASFTGLAPRMMRMGLANAIAMQAAKQSVQGTIQVLSRIGQYAFSELQNAVREAMRLDDTVRDIAIHNRQPGGPLADTTAMRKEFEQTAISNKGMTAEQVAHGVGAAAQASGDLSGARGMRDVIAKVSQATGEDAGKVGDA